MLDRQLSASTINVKLSAVRKLINRGKACRRRQRGRGRADDGCSERPAAGNSSWKLADERPGQGFASGSGSLDDERESGIT